MAFDLTDDQLAELRHLLNLLDLLPEDTDDWWHKLSLAVSKVRDNYPEPHYIKDNVTFTRSCIRQILAGERRHDPLGLRQVSYVTLLDVDDDEVATLIGKRVMGGGWVGAETGRRWINDASESAWRFHVSQAGRREV